MNSSAPVASSALSVRRCAACCSKPRRFNTPVSASEVAIDCMRCSLALPSVISTRVIAMSLPKGSQIMRSHLTPSCDWCRTSISRLSPASAARVNRSTMSSTSLPSMASLALRKISSPVFSTRTSRVTSRKRAATRLANMQRSSCRRPSSTSVQRMRMMPFTE